MAGTRSSGRKRVASASPPPAAKAPAKKRQPAKKATAAPADDEPPTAADSIEEESSKVGTDAQIAKGDIAKSDILVPIDEGFPQQPGHRVYIGEEDSVIYDASLNQTHASDNHNKFYRLQILQTPAQEFITWTRWGRVGEHGQNATLGNGSLEDALSQFDKKFKAKTGHSWANRGEPPKAGKYVFVERSYDPDDNAGDSEEPQANGCATEKRRSSSPPKCSLPPQTESLMKLIFNQQYFDAVMLDMHYDANKLPLGKLSTATIARGFQALKDLSEHLHDPAARAQVEHHSNLYYSYIPHAFGRNRPPIINTHELLKREVDLLESLSDLKDADNILKAEQEEGVQELHPLDFKFKGLGMQEMECLRHDSSEFSEIAQYLLKTSAVGHGIEYAVQDVFRIERQGEFERANKSGFGKTGSDRRLLWHGSSATNYGGILSQGLRIAPPEAPVSGYMFDKGIYLADMSSKSANYCRAYTTGGDALLLLCEAELGDPMQTLLHSQSDAGEQAKKQGLLSTWGQGGFGPLGWKDAGCAHPSLKGVKMPDMSQEPGDTGIAQSSLRFNEFICYDVAQVKLRYLLRVKM